jgi:TatD DNase family protein
MVRMYIDAHAHLDKYGQEIEQAIAEIERHQIFTVSVSMDPAAYAVSKEIEKRTRRVVSCFGVHPWDAPEYHAQLAAFQPLIDDSPMIGEIGLDYYFVRDLEKHALQRDVFRHFVKHGAAQNKILNVHSKGAEADVDRILGDFGAARTIVHWYAGSINHLHRLAEKGAFFTVGVGILFSNRTKKIAKAIPADRLLTETDNPGGYQSFAGSLGMPSIMIAIVENLSELRGWSIDETKRIVNDNFLRLANNDAWSKKLLEAEPQTFGA